MAAGTEFQWVYIGKEKEIACATVGLKSISHLVFSHVTMRTRVCAKPWIAFHDGAGLVHGDVLNIVRVSDEQLVHDSRILCH